MDVMRRAVGFVRTVNIIVRLQDGWRLAVWFDRPGRHRKRWRPFFL